MPGFCGRGGSSSVRSCTRSSRRNTRASSSMSSDQSCRRNFSRSSPPSRARLSQRITWEVRGPSSAPRQADMSTKWRNCSGEAMATSSAASSGPMSSSAKYSSSGGSEETSCCGSGAERIRSSFCLPRAFCSARRAARGSRRALPLASLTPAASGRLGDLAGLQAASADAQVLVRSVHHRAHPLEVGERPLLRLVVGVRHLVPDQGSLAAQIALECHGKTSLPKKERGIVLKSLAASSRPHRLAPGEGERPPGGGPRREDLSLQPEPGVGGRGGEHDVLVCLREGPQSHRIAV